MCGVAVQQGHFPQPWGALWGLCCPSEQLPLGNSVLKDSAPMVPRVGLDTYTPLKVSVPMLMVIGRTFGVASEKPENALENTMNGNFSSIGTRQGGTGVNSIYWAHVPWLYGWSDDILLSYCFIFNLTLCLLSLALKEMLDL